MEKVTCSLILLLALSACAHAVPTMDELVGCYQVEVGEWTDPPPGLQKDELEEGYGLPPTLRFGESRFFDMGWRFEPVPGKDYDYWQRGWFRTGYFKIENQRIRGVRKFVGEHGWTEFEVIGRRHNLEGSVKAMVMWGSQEEEEVVSTAPIVLRRMECPADIDESVTINCVEQELALAYLCTVTDKLGSVIEKGEFYFFPPTFTFARFEIENPDIYRGWDGTHIYLLDGRKLGMLVPAKFNDEELEKSHAVQEPD